MISARVGSDSDSPGVRFLPPRPGVSRNRTDADARVISHARYWLIDAFPGNSVERGQLSAALQPAVPCAEEQVRIAEHVKPRVQLPLSTHTQELGLGERKRQRAIVVARVLLQEREEHSPCPVR